MAEIGLGMAALGRPQYINVGNKGLIHKTYEAYRENASQVLEAAYRLGIRYFDTAPGYGAAENFLHDFLYSAGYRASIKIATKWGYTYTADWQLNPDTHEVKEHSVFKLNEQWKESRVLLPNIVLYQIHSATLESGVLENIQVLDRLADIRDSHGIRIGLTTSGVQQGEVIHRALDVVYDGVPLFEGFQVTYNILERSQEELIKQLVSADKYVIIKEVLANGRLLPHAGYTDKQNLYQLLERISHDHRVSTDAVVIRYVMDKIGPSVVLSGAATVEHLESNLAARDINLTHDELSALSAHAMPSEDYWDERKSLVWQ